MTTFLKNGQTAFLRNPSDWTSWIDSIKAVAIHYEIWDQIRPEGPIEPPRERPIPPICPEARDYQGLAAFPEPTNAVHLTANGLRAYRLDVEAYNARTTKYKTDMDIYEKDRKHLGKLMQMVQSTVSMHYKDTCCNPERPLQHWIATLRVTAGDDDRYEQDLARERYHKALQPMKNPNNWEIWLARYDEAASYAEKNGVVEVSSLNAIIKDFTGAVTKVAENWTSNFLDYGRDDPQMTRKEMMRKFRVQMTNKYPNRVQMRSNTRQSASFFTAPVKSLMIALSEETSTTPFFSAYDAASSYLASQITAVDFRGVRAVLEVAWKAALEIELCSKTH
ncbi:hypothetical protein E4U19_007975 [Claviceps sp. Clav32 group G5]|nr:hypothetical protein E4U19_007975 [Claviceps sp. Clav32 group G5]KAG6045867.1 hypothetical protein E4U39_001849 [Claviceps sp. Clav50 group G5]